MYNYIVIVNNLNIIMNKFNLMLWSLIRFSDSTLPLKWIFLACILLFSEINTNNPYLYSYIFI